MLDGGTRPPSWETWHSQALILLHMSMMHKLTGSETAFAPVFEQKALADTGANHKRGMVLHINVAFFIFESTKQQSQAY